MNKLEEIIQAFTRAKKDANQQMGNWYYSISMENLEYLLSLIEEKDKALSFYEDLDNYKDYRGYFSRETAADRDSGNLARKALRGE